MSVNARDVTICNARGLHARASVKLVQTAQRFDARVFVEKDGVAVEASSVLGLMMLAAARGSALRLTAEGAEAAGALDAIATLIAAGFHED